MRGNTNVKLTC